MKVPNRETGGKKRQDIIGRIVQAGSIEADPIAAGAIEDTEGELGAMTDEFVRDVDKVNDRIGQEVAIASGRRGVS